MMSGVVVSILFIFRADEFTEFIWYWVLKKYFKHIEIKLMEGNFTVDKGHYILL